MDNMFDVALWPMMLGIYLLPTFVAWFLKHQQLPAIAALNVVLGWTVLGWIGALALASKEEPANLSKKKSRRRSTRNSHGHKGEARISPTY